MRSLTATSSNSGRSMTILKAALPILPIPLIATLVITNLLHKFHNGPLWPMSCRYATGHLSAHCSASGGATMVRTGQVAWRTTFSATDPKTSRRQPVSPWEAMTMRSTCSCLGDPEDFRSCFSGGHQVPGPHFMMGHQVFEHLLRLDRQFLLEQGHVKIEGRLRVGERMGAWQRRNDMRHD